MSTKSDKIIKTAVIGFGFIGPSHWKNLGALDGIERYAVADPDNIVGRTHGKFVPRLYEDWTELVDNPEIDVVHICGPNNFHKEMVLRALGKGKHVVCEKPLSLDPLESKEMVLAARDAAKDGIMTMVNFNYWGHQLARYANHLVKSGELGKVRILTGQYLQDWLLTRRDYNWRALGDSCAFADIGAHILDLLSHGSGQRPVSVYSDLHTFVPVRDMPKRPLNTFEDAQTLPASDFNEVKIKADDYATVLIDFDGGAKGNIMATQVWPGKKNWMEADFVGDKQAYHWEQPSPDKAWVGRRFGENSDLIRGTVGAHEKMSGLPAEHPIGYSGASSNQFGEFYASIREGKQIGEYPQFERGHTATCVINAAVKSRQSGMRESVDYLGL